VVEEEDRCVSPREIGTVEASADVDSLRRQLSDLRHSVADVLRSGGSDVERGDITEHQSAAATLDRLLSGLHADLQERTAKLEHAIGALEQELSRRHDAESAYRDAERRYRWLYDNNPSMYFTLTPDGTVVSVNEFGASQLGYRPDELTGRSVLTVFAAADHPSVLKQVRQCADRVGTTFEWEMQKVRKNGSRLWVRERARAAVGPDGQPVILVVCEDITVHRQATQLVSTLVRECALPIVSLDAEARVTSWNHAATRLFGWSEEEVLGKELPYVPPGEEAQADALWVSGTRSHIDGPIELRRRRKDGSLLDLLLWPVFVHDETGQVSTAIGLYVDQSDLKRAEAARLNSELRLRSFLDALDDVAFEIDKEGQFLNVWTRNEDLLLLPKPEIVGKRLSDVYGEAESRYYLSIVARVIETGRSESVEYALTIRGHIRHFSAVLSRIPAAGDQRATVACVVRETTRQKAAEVALRDSTHAIRDLQEATSTPGLTLDQRIHTVLRLGCRRFRLGFGVLTRVNGAQLEITHVYGDDAVLQPGMQLPLCESYCGATLLQDQPLAIAHAGACSWKTHPAYRRLGLEAYLGAKLTGRRADMGTICFLDARPSTRPFTEADTDFLLLMARWLSGELERREAEAALRLTQSAVDRAADFAFWIDESARFHYVNEAACQRLGYSREELLAMTVADVDPDYQAETWPDHWHELRQAGRLRFETRHRTKSGELYPVEVVANHVIVDGREYNFAFSRDISDRKRAEAALRASELRLQRFVAEAPIGLMILDNQRRVLTANKAFCELTGYAEQDLVGQTYALYTHPEDLARNMALTDGFYRGERSEYSLEKRYVKKSGDVIWVSVKATSVELPNHPGPLLLAVVQDITERRRSAEEREQFSQDLHDNILQSLYAVGMQLEASKLTFGKAPRKSRAYTTQAIDHLNRLVGEVRQFIALLRQETSVSLDFAQALRQLASSFSPAGETAPELEITDAVIGLVTSEQGEQLLNIAREALSNSMRHAQATRRWIRLSRAPGAIRMQICDDGIGFDPKAKRKPGHGLTNMAARAKRIHARFSLDSKPRQGTCITIDLPMEDS
jgi:PAS domain S-box-containing protein